MIVTITGFKNRNYTKKETGEYIEAIEVHFTKKIKSDGFGSETGCEYVTRRAFPEAYDYITNAKEKAVGCQVSISTCARTFNGKSYTSLDEFEIVK